MKHIFSNIGFMLRQCMQADRSVFWVSMAVYALRFLKPVSEVIGMKCIFDALTGKTGFESIVLIVAVYCILNMIPGFLNAWYTNSYMPAAEIRIARYLDIRLMRKTASLDLEAFDDERFYDRYTRAKNEITSRAVGVIHTLCGAAGAAVSIAMLSAVILAIEPFLIVCILAGTVLSFLLDLAKSGVYYRFDRENTRLRRRMDYIRRIFYEPQYLTELRLFGIKELGAEKYADCGEELCRKLRRQGRTKTALNGVNVLLEAGLFSGSALLYLGWRVWRGILSVGDFSAMFSAVFSFGNELYSFVSKFPELYRHALFIDNLREVLSADGTIECGGTVPADFTKPHTVEFQDVTFRYKNGVRGVEHLSFKIEAGEKAAIVGYNGAGKSTLIKLLCRLYEPQSGRILINGRDIRSYDTRSLRESMGIVLQDFHHYAFTVAENVCPDGQCRREEIQSALEKAGLADKIRSLPRGIDTPLTREFESDGAVMSGGEFQKLSAARARLHEPKMLILDECTSALDPLAAEKMRKAMLRGTEDRTVLFISHRLSSARYADKILMMEDGRIAESGTHEELMARGGKYAVLFRLQAEKYSD